MVRWKCKINKPLGCLSSRHNLGLQYLGAGARTNRRRGAAHILNLHPAGQNPKTLGHLLVADTPGGGGQRGEENTKDKDGSDGH